MIDESKNLYGIERKAGELNPVCAYFNFSDQEQEIYLKEDWNLTLSSDWEEYSGTTKKIEEKSNKFVLPPFSSIYLTK